LTVTARCDTSPPMSVAFAPTTLNSHRLLSTRLDPARTLHGIYKDHTLLFTTPENNNYIVSKLTLEEISKPNRATGATSLPPSKPATCGTSSPPSTRTTSTRCTPSTLTPLRPHRRPHRPRRRESSPTRPSTTSSASSTAAILPASRRTGLIAGFDSYSSAVTKLLPRSACSHLHSRSRPSHGMPSERPGHPVDSETSSLEFVPPYDYYFSTNAGSDLN
jgi:hypothetical protein